MSETSVRGSTDRPTKRQRGGLGRAIRNASRTTRGRIGVALTFVVALVAFIGPFLPTLDPNAFLAPPFSKPGTGAGPLGADVLGRSVLSRLLHGGWQLLAAALIATALALVVGAIVGVVAAYKEGWTDLLLMRSADVLLVIPQLVLALLLVSISGTSTALLVLAVAVSQAPQVARVVHASAQNVCEKDFVKAVALWGVPSRRVIAGQVLPNLVTPLSVEAGLRLSFSIILISGLNFLGFGVTPPDASWGVMINENRIGLGINPWGVVAPAIVLGVLAVGTNMFADAIARANLGDDHSEVFELTASLPQEQADDH
jgi:peptide/nickel transport system permease protein